MEVFVTGGTGFVGAHIVKKLVAQGEHVTVLIRPGSSIALIAGLPIKFVAGNLLEENSLVPHLQGIEVLYHVAADYRLWSYNPSEIYRANVDGTRNILQAALSNGVRRVVYTSTVGCLGLPKDGSSGDENTPVCRDELIGHYKKSKYDAELVALDYVRKGLDVVIVSPSTPVGPGDIKPTPTGKIILDYLNGKMCAYVDTGLNLIAVEDVADGHLLAAQKGRMGEKYILGNKNLALREVLNILAGITGRTPPKLRIPHSIAIAAAMCSSGYAKFLGKEPGIPIEGALMARKKMFFTAEKALRALGLPQSSVEDALARSVDWFVKNGYVK